MWSVIRLWFQLTTTPRPAPRRVCMHQCKRAPPFDRWAPRAVPWRGPSLSQRLFLNSISRCSSSLVVAASLVLNGRNRIATAGDYEEVDALAVDCAVGPRIGGGEHLT
jgi:hypothetical protein